MTIHVLIQCTKSKLISPKNGLIWDKAASITNWAEKWDKAEPKLPVEEMYTGRFFQENVSFINDVKDCTFWVVSAGSGLIQSDQMIPAYEATFRPGMGPTPSEWHLLPSGGLENITLEKGDTIVCFLSPKYEQAIIEDPTFEELKHAFVVRENSKIASKSSDHLIKIHPRSREVLKVASVNLNSALTKLYLEQGHEGMENLFSECEKLEPNPKRRRVNAKELEEILSDLPKDFSLQQVVRHLRDDMLISASYERIRDNLAHLRD